MSFNRLSYDQNTYQRHLNANVGVLGYIMNPLQYEHQQKCRHEFGLVGGTNVSHINGNLVDLESEMRGQTHILSKCGTNQPKPLTIGDSIQNDKTSPVSTQMKHLPSCQMISYKSIQAPPPYYLPKMA